MVRRLPVARAAPGQRRCPSPSSRSTRRASPRIGQWPWPRTQLARLVNTLNRADAAAIGLNVLMPEADALSPERLLVASRRCRTDRSSRRCAACSRTTRCLPARSPRRRRCWPSPARPMPRGRRCARRRVTVQATASRRATPPSWPIVRHAGALTSIDELEQPGQRLGPDLGRHHARHRPPHSARRQRPGHARADAGGRDAPRRLSRARHPADRRMARSVTGLSVGRPACRPRRTARFASTTRSIAPIASSRRSMSSRTGSTRRCCASSWC